MVIKFVNALNYDGNRIFGIIPRIMMSKGYVTDFLKIRIE